DRVDDGKGAADGRHDRAVVMDVRLDRLDPGRFAVEQRMPPLGMTRGDPDLETGRSQMANDPPSEKPGSAEYRHYLRGHRRGSRQDFARRTINAARRCDGRSGGARRGGAGETGPVIPAPISRASAAAAGRRDLARARIM